MIWKYERRDDGLRILVTGGSGTNTNPTNGTNPAPGQGSGGADNGGDDYDSNGN